MTQKNRSDLTTEINTLIADAPAGNITAADVRTVNTNAIDSSFNLITDDSDTITEGATNLFLTTTERTRIAYEWSTHIFANGSDYTAGASNSLTLPTSVPGNDKDYLRVYFEAVKQANSQWNVAGTTLTFTSTIPLGVELIEVHILS